MTLAQTSALRTWLGATGAVICVFFLLSLSDALIARLRQPIDYLPCLPGQSLAVTGRLPEKIDSIDELTYLADSKEIRVVFDDFQTGYWLGGRMWRGRIIVSRNAKAGRYEVSISLRDGPHAALPSTFRVEVYPDASGLKRASHSFIARYIGASPWMASILLAPLVVFTFGAVFILSQIASRLMEREGRAEIWRVAKVEQGYEIHFSLGLSQGSMPGRPSGPLR